ncbi:MAG: hydroxyethylthiazole kinase [Anaerovibrio sp.]|uniref:hydroxyethylthiazole kinase n=1 Tax=Anaerovibrio sp. TaxID=1872532 RepID=UPI0025DE5634|nr:hydroxyethylthiazole kinase [Anaerovibrio sp.]MCR5176377.1 hydroxyethylthiazole kinase [Anaerovibrio sp.]
MINKQLSNELLALREQTMQLRPLIHCITNPISINDCANIILSVGARPMMAEHPDEVAEITSSAAALCLNLGSITRDRLTAIKRAATAANKNDIPIIIDVVGTACSSLRKKFVLDFIPDHLPRIIKGNISEILAICDIDCHSSGVEANKNELITMDNAPEYAKVLSSWARKYNTVFLVSGPIDFMTDGSTSYLTDNGVPMLGNITGTGCMLNALTAAYMSVGQPIHAALLAAVSFGLAGELADKKTGGPGTFHMQLFDELYNLRDADIITKGSIIAI